MRQALTPVRDGVMMPLRRRGQLLCLGESDRICSEQNIPRLR
jgi:hypothetical protein